MKQIRKNVFETNSSSTHSICISKAPATIGKHISFHTGRYGRKNGCVDTPSYLYTAILCQEEKDELLSKLKNILDSHSITYEFEEPGQPYDDYYIDHDSETREFIYAVLNDEDLLMRCLFGDSCVWTGNDNNYADDMSSAAYPLIYDENNTPIPNPNHHPEKYDYFFKGN